MILHKIIFSHMTILMNFLLILLIFSAFKRCDWYTPSLRPISSNANLCVIELHVWATTIHKQKIKIKHIVCRFVANIIHHLWNVIQNYQMQTHLYVPHPFKVAKDKKQLPNIFSILKNYSNIFMMMYFFLKSKEFLQLFQAI